MSSSSFPAVRKGGSVTDLRESNLSLVLQTLSTFGALSRAEIAEHCGLGVTALTSLVHELTARRLVVESSELVRPAIGRPTSLLEMDTSHWSVVGILCDREQISIATGGLDGVVVSITRYPVPAGSVLGFDSYRPFLVRAVADALMQSHGRGRTVAAVEVAVPGAVNRDSGEVVRSILNGWSRVALRGEIQHMFTALSQDPGCKPSRVVPVLVGVDRETNYSMLTQVYGGKRSLSGRNLAYLGGRNALSGGLYSRSAIEHGAAGLAGEFGHLVVDPEGSKCWCGRRGCVETRLGLAHLYSVCTGLPETDSFSRLGSAHQSMLNELLSGAKEQDQRYLLPLKEAGRWLGIAIDTIAAVVNPDEFVVDGYLACLQEYLEPGARVQLDALSALPSLSGLRIKFGSGDEDGSLRGAVLAARDALIRHPAAATRPKRLSGKIL
ncbi:ROK family protein [Arthrobacter dokdonensis]|uniref:ROK family protein n=1 Tax=Arthrobacter dokdonellae TaxID=2211210 RepID=UPI001013C4E2|nr:ROK family protein [Arthrobacter dokdonellae]